MLTKVGLFAMLASNQDMEEMSMKICNNYKCEQYDTGVAGKCKDLLEDLGKCVDYFQDHAYHDCRECSCHKFNENFLYNCAIVWLKDIKKCRYYTIPKEVYQTNNPKLEEDISKRRSYNFQKKPTTGKEAVKNWVKKRTVQKEPPKDPYEEHFIAWCEFSKWIANQKSLIKKDPPKEDFSTKLLINSIVRWWKAHKDDSTSFMMEKIYGEVPEFVKIAEDIKTWR